MELDAFRQWLTERRLRPQTVHAYVACVRLALRRGDPIKCVLEAQSRGRRQQYYAALKQYAAFLGDDGKELSLKLLNLPRFRSPDKAPTRPLDRVEWNALLESAQEEEEPLCQILVLLIYTGLRSSDIINIEHAQVREGLETGTMYLAQKGGSYRPFPVEGRIRRALWELDEGWRWKTIRELLSSGKSDRAAYMVVYRALNAVGERAGLEKQRRYPHLMRATVAAQIYERTKDINKVMKWLGHKEPSQTFTYLKYSDPGDLGDTLQMLEESRKE